MLDRVLFSGDWQLQFSNLHKAKAMQEELLDICSDKKVHAVVNGGDVKENYNPVDLRVTNFAIRNTKKISKYYPYLINLGNHDRAGLYTDTINWLPVLKEAGAITFDEPGNYEELYFLPFTTSVSAFKQYASKLARSAKHVRRPLLSYHQDLRHCQYNVHDSARSKDSRIRVKDIYPDVYLYCIGSHIHLQQNVSGNVWYAGTPFPMDWGESNQRKGYLLVDRKESTIEQVWSDLPRMYDPSWPRFEESKPKSWKGASVRISVNCDDTHNIQKKLDHAKDKAESKYKGAHIVTVPEFSKTQDIASFISIEDTDKKKIESYVSQTCPHKLKSNREQIVAYLSHQLSLVQLGTRSTTGFEAIRAEAENFLGFKKLKVNYESGLTVITGHNKDWPGRSNGVGKTSWLQPPSVALFGETFKGQKHNRWARRNCEDPAVIKFTFKTQDGRECVVTRGRKPPMLKFEIDGKDKSTGNSHEATKKLIEEITGYTRQTLANAVYIDQKKMNSLLSGTDGDRREILEQLTNTERFKKAQELIKQDLKVLSTEEQRLNQDYEIKKAIVETTESQLHQFEKSSVKGLERKLHKADKALSKRNKYLETHNFAHKLTSGRVRQQELEKGLLRLGKVESRLGSEIDVAQEHIENFKSLTSKNKCRTCLQLIDKDLLKSEAQYWKEKLNDAQGEQNKVKYKILKFELAKEELDDEATKIEHHREQWNKVHWKYEMEVRILTDNLAKQRKARSEYDRLKSKLYQVKREYEIARKLHRFLYKDRRFLTYCEEVFSRKGLPSFLHSQLIPQLNKSAKTYAKLFSDNEIQVVFELEEEGTLIPRVVNAHGGEGVDDQSRGEEKIATLITSFAFKDLAPPTNILILDEPGDGLDEYNSRVFARALQKIAKRFGCVLVTSHNEFIQSELLSKRHVRIVKENGISKVA